MHVGTLLTQCRLQLASTHYHLTNRLVIAPVGRDIPDTKGFAIQLKKETKKGVHMRHLGIVGRRPRDALPRGVLVCLCGGVILDSDVSESIASNAFSGVNMSRKCNIVETTQ